MTLRRTTVLFLLLCSGISIGSAQADVTPPLIATIEPLGEPLALGTPFEVRLSVTVPRTGSNRETQLKLTLTATGVVRSVGQTEWTIDRFELDRAEQVTTSVVMAEYGEGGLRLQAESFDAAGHRLWGRADDLFILQTPTESLSGKSSTFELKREKLRRDRARNRLTAAEYEQEVQRLTSGQALRFEMEMRGIDTKKKTAEAPEPRAVVASVTVSGKATYTHRTGVNAGANVYAAAADARPIVNSTVRFFDQNGGTDTQLVSVPPVVVTDASGNYTATIPGVRADNVTAVNLVVGVSTDNDAVTVGPIGGTSVHVLKTPPSAVDAATKTVDVVVDSSTPVPLAGFSIAEAALVSFNFVRDNNSRTGVGAAPAKIWVEYPGDKANGSYFSTSGGDHLNIGQNQGFDWDVLTHEYGHYVQKINGTTANPGGDHIISGNNTGVVQTLNDGSQRTLTKDQGIKLAWGEGWPTFFGSNLQISSGAGAFGIYTAGDTVYTDTGNNFKYALEANSDTDVGAGTGEDNELSVQRLLWDFADAPQDGHDEAVFGTDEMWKQLNTAPKPQTLNEFRAKFDNLVPSSPAAYGTGSQEENRIKYGRMYFDHNIGPEPLEPRDNFSSGTPPKFRWKTMGAGAAPSYHFNKFNVLFFNKDYSTLIFTSPEIPTAEGTLAADGLTAEWTPTAPQWTQISSGDQLIHWVVQGSSDLAPATGPYRGLDRTIGGLSIVFVIDDTGSMEDEIGGVRDGLTAFIGTLRSLGLPRTPVIEVITFKDGWTRQISSRNLDEVQAVVSGLAANGGDDCPEASGEALLAAVNDLGPAEAGLNGVMIFATDASPHAGFDLTGIKLRALSKGVIIYQLVTGDCDPEGGLPAAAGLGVGCSDNHDPHYVPRPPAPGVVWPSDVICPECPVSDGVGPFMSPNILKPVGDYSLPAASSVASFMDIATASPNGQFLYLPGVKSGDPEPFRNAVTNAALASVLPTVLGVQPVDGYPGATMDVQILGGNTNFQSTSVLAISGGGITINSQTPIGPTTMVANITVDPAATTGFRNVTVTTNLGGGTVETAGGTGQFRISPATGYPELTSVTPATVARGSAVRLNLSGLNTHFAGGATSVSIGDPYARTGVTVNAVTVTSPTALQADITIAETASLGFFPVTVTTGDEYVYLTNVLAVVTSLAPPVTIPKIVSVVPSSGPQGVRNLDLAVTGQNTNFVNGTTVGNVNGSGITVVSTSVSGPTTATIRINIVAGAPLGFRDIVLTTGGETAALVDGFQVVTGVPACTGDCDENGLVTVDELVTGVNILLELAPLDRCPVFDLDGSGTVTVEELVQAVNYLLGMCPAAPPTATPTPTGSLAPTTPGGVFTPTPTRSVTPTVTTTASSTTSPSPTTPAAVLTSTPTRSVTPTASTTPGGSSVAESVAGSVIAAVNGMNVLPSIVAGIASAFRSSGASMLGEAAEFGEAAASCTGGSATRTGSFPNVTITLSNCGLSTTSGLLVLNGTVVVTGVLFPPYNVTVNVTATFKNATGTTTLLTASATNVTGTISPSLSGTACYVSGAGLQLNGGTLSMQIPGGAGVSLVFAGSTNVAVAVDAFNTDCVPLSYSLTFNNGPVTITTTTGGMAAAVGGNTFAVTFSTFVVSQDTRVGETQMNGDIVSTCFGGRITVQTLTALTQDVGVFCPNGGKIQIALAGDGTAWIVYLATQGVGIDTNMDTVNEETFTSCLDQPLLTCVSSGTPTATRSVTPGISVTATASVTASVSPSATSSRTGSPSSVTPTTPSPTPTPSVTPSATPTATGTPGNALVYCDTLSNSVVIPDNNTAGINNTISVPTAGNIADLNVLLSIAHEWVGDLKVTLTHVDTGTQRVLIDRPGVPSSTYGCGEQDVFCTLDDEAVSSVENQCATSSSAVPAIDGGFRPNNLLSAFDGQSLAGSWRLNVSDNDTGFTGSLIGWCLVANAAAPTVGSFTCNGLSHCNVSINEPFDLDFTFADADADADSFRVTIRDDGGNAYEVLQSAITPASGGDTILLHSGGFTCPSGNCITTEAEYVVIVTDSTGLQSAPVSVAITIAGS